MRTLLGVDTAAVSLLGGDGCFVQDARGRTHATQACWADTLAGWPLLQPTDANGLVTELSVSGKRCALWRSRLRVIFRVESFAGCLVLQPTDAVGCSQKCARLASSARAVLAGEHGRLAAWPDLREV